jgi:hypothetical protein
MEVWAKLAQFPEMAGGKPFDDPATFRRQSEFNAAPIHGRSRAPKEAGVGQPVHEAHDTMMAQVQPGGQFRDRGEIAAREPLQGEQGLVLLRGQAGPPRGFLAEIQELAQRLPESGE